MRQRERDPPSCGNERETERHGDAPIQSSTRRERQTKREERGKIKGERV